MEHNVFEGFTGQYSLSKTLRFELRPQGRTQEYIDVRGIIGEDEARDRDYETVKKAIDEYHKGFMERSLRRLELKGLDEYCDLMFKRERSEKENRELEKQEENLRKQVVECFKADEKYALLFKSQLITEELPKVVTDQDTKDALEKFKKFTTYFQGFFENRKNIYTDEAKSTAVAYRIVNQNLPRFLDNRRVFFKLLKTELSDSLNELENNLSDILGGKPLDTFFEIQNYPHTVTNEDIDRYNCLIGGRSLADGQKIKGINEYVNEYNQKIKKVGNARRLPKLKPLYKQILSDRESLSVYSEPFEDDGQLVDAVRKFVTHLSETVLNRKSSRSLPALLEHIGEYQLDGIFVKNGFAINDLSNKAYGDWSALKSCFEKEYDDLNKNKKRNEKYYEERNRRLKQKGSYSLDELNCTAVKYGGLEGHLEQIFALPIEKSGQALWDVFDDSYQKLKTLLNTDYAGKQELASDKKSVALLKELLDCIKSIETFVKPLLGTGSEAEKDDNFYGELDVLYAQLSQITPLYNKVRNYVTKKPYSIEKVKINFQNPDLLKGWAKGTELERSGLIFRKNGNYYLGIIAKYQRKFYGEYPEPVNDEDVIEKMEYLQIADPSKDVQNLMVVNGVTVKVNGRKEREGEFAGQNLRLEDSKNKYLPGNINVIRKKKSYSTLSDTFEKDDLISFIDYYKSRVIEYYKDYDFVFKESKDYGSFADFTDDINRQAYQLKMRKISEAYINQLVNDGKLYLFQIYSKDFSPYTKGRPNLHTIYWKMLFDERNLNNVVYKLNGEAEIFYRRASINEENQIIHHKGKPIAKKNLKAAEKGETSCFKYDLIKDKRYTADKYQFHVPMTLNFCAEGKGNLNGLVQDTVCREKGLNVIGIDRGERNLLYLCVVSPEGKIICQKSLNKIENDKGYEQNYHALLDKKERDMKKAREDWMEITSIKELKEGYLSQAIHIITDLMLEHQAVVVLEDLNFGFINGRKKVEKQIYQKFEKMLIDKLNYLVNKSADAEQPGGALKAYQLTNQFESFAKLGRQSGFLFYIQAWNTSKIDPTTGFVNLLSVKYTSMKDAKAFLEKFDFIRYNSSENYFEFALDYKNFTDRAVGIRTKWVLCSQGSRVVNFRNPEKNSQWDAKEIDDLTEQIRNHFEQYGVKISEENMVADICSVDQAKFFQDIMGDIKLLVQMRNSMPNTDVDYMISPVKNADGKFFDTRTYQKDNADFNYFPQDADANGAYNIARKGLMILERIRQEKGKAKLAISNQEWLEYAQEHPLRKE